MGQQERCASFLASHTSAIGMLINNSDKGSSNFYSI